MFVYYIESVRILFPCGPVSQYVSFEGADCLLAGAEFLYWAHLDGSIIEALYQTIDVQTLGEGHSFPRFIHQCMPSNSVGL